MKIKCLITWPTKSDVGVIEGKIYEVEDSSYFPEQVGVMSEDKSGLTWLSSSYKGVKEFEVLE